MPALSTQTVVIIAIIVLAVAIGVAYLRRRNGGRARRLLLSQWGEASERKFSANELASIYTQAQALAGEKGFTVDNITWNDLDMDKLYERVNATYTAAGDHALYEMLRNPLGNIDALGQREKTMAWAKADKAGRERIKGILYGLGRMGSIDLNAVFASDWFSRGKWIGCIASCSALILCIVLAIFGVGAAILPAILLAFANVVIAMRSGALIGSYISLAQYMSSVLLAAKRIAAENNPELDPVNARINELQGQVKGVLGSGLMALYNSYNDPTNGIYYLKLFFLTELIGFYNLARGIIRYREEIIELYRLVGTVDSLIAVASWRETLELWCRPELDAKLPAKQISFTELAHPLLRDPVTNSLDINENVLLTGSNATGKSTFLKTVAINAILAQS